MRQVATINLQCENLYFNFSLSKIFNSNSSKRKGNVAAHVVGVKEELSVLTWAVASSWSTFENIYFYPKFHLNLFKLHSQWILVVWMLFAFFWIAFFYRILSWWEFTHHSSEWTKNGSENLRHGSMLRWGIKRVARIHCHSSLLNHEKFTNVRLPQIVLSFLQTCEGNIAVYFTKCSVQ